MGVIVFLLATTIGVYWLYKFYSSLSSNIPAGSFRRTTRSTYPLTNGLITPVAEAEIPDKLVPQSSDRVLPIVPQSAPSIGLKSYSLPNFTTPPAPIEASLLLRVLIQGLLIVSTIGTDLAGGIHFSAIAIPFTTVGAAWSWHRRHYAKHWLNIAVSIFSLGILMVIFVPMFTREWQTIIATGVEQSTSIALLLGILLVLLQMGLSFHLYSRRILGYAIATSIVLIGVAASLSKNIGFLVLLAGFMAIAIPTLMLDYRSRLRLKPLGIDSIPTPQELPWKYLSQLAASSIILGLMLAVFLPNFHAPSLTDKPPGIDNLQTLAEQYRPQTPSQPTSTPAPPQLNPQELARNVLGQTGNNNYPDIIKQNNLQLPPEVTKELNQFTQKVLATSPQPLNSDFDKSTYLAEYLKQHHQDDLQDPSQQPPIEAKTIQKLIAKCPAELKDCKLVGNRQDLPIVYTSMLRSIGIPARLKMGDKPGEIDPNTQMYSRPPGQAQSQTEVYFPNWGWFPLDSTPDRPVINPTPSQLAQLQQNLPPAPQASPPSISEHTLHTPTTPPISPTPAVQPSWNPDPVILRIIITAIGLCGGIAWYLWYQQQQLAKLAKLPPVEQIYQMMVKNLSDRGLTKHPAQTQLEYANSASKTYHPQIAKVVLEISQVYTAWRYGKQKIDIKQLAKKLHQLQQLQQLAAKKQRRQWFAKIRANSH